MILIVDSGSTKADWRLINQLGENLKDFSTMGFNPYFHSSDLVETELRKSANVMEIASFVEHVFFYGAGCSSVTLDAIIQEGLSRVFTNANVLVGHDLEACAFATYYGEPEISCILGTGSNSCYFDGVEVTEAVPSLAYILGDEGSGSYFGKRLLQDYFYKLLPEDMAEAFHSEFNLTDKDIVRKVYNEPNANVYLASFMKFIGKFKDHPHVENWMVDGFRHFLEIHVKCYSNWADVKVNFIGSVAFHFRKYLEMACETENVILGDIIKKPIDNLVRYHIEYKIPELVKV